MNRNTNRDYTNWPKQQSMFKPTNPRKVEPDTSLKLGLDVQWNLSRSLEEHCAWSHTHTHTHTHKRTKNQFNQDLEAAPSMPVFNKRGAPTHIHTTVCIIPHNVHNQEEVTRCEYAQTSVLFLYKIMLYAPLCVQALLK